MVKFIMEFIRYNEITTLLFLSVFWFVGFAVFAEFFIWRPFRWIMYDNIFKGMDTEDRYEILTFKHARW